MKRFMFVLYDPRKFFASILLLLFVLPLVFVATASRQTGAITIDANRQCDDRAVIRCGALNYSELQDRYQTSGVADIYNYFGISGNDIANACAHSVQGFVNDQNQVIVNNQVVATNAYIAGRQYREGSSAVSNGSTSFYVFPPSLSFSSSSTPAYVFVDDNGRFMHAILASGGSPVMATPVYSYYQWHEQPYGGNYRPTFECRGMYDYTTRNNPNQYQNQYQQQNQQQYQPPQQQNFNYQQPQTQTYQVPQQQTSTPAVTTTGSTTYEAPAPVQTPQKTTSTPTPTSYTSAKTLPNTGPSDAAMISGVAAVLGTIGHSIFSRRRY